MVIKYASIGSSMLATATFLRRSATLKWLAAAHVSRVGFDQGKVPLSPSEVERTAQAAGEPESFVDLNIYSKKAGLYNPELARKLMKAILLLRDWEEINLVMWTKLFSLSIRLSLR